MLLAGCRPGTGDITSLSVLLKEPPGHIEAAVVTISRVDLIGPNGPVSLLHQPQVLDLLDPSRTPVGLVNDFAVPALPYHELRVHLRGMYMAVRNPDGAVVRYATPGYPGAPEGVKLDRAIDLSRWAEAGLSVTLAGGTLDLRGEQTILVLELDALKGLITAAELGSTGGIRVILERPSGSGLPVGGATVTLFDDRRNLVGVAHDLVGPDADGNFEAMFGLLSPGNYEVVVSPPNGWSLQSHASNVSVALGEASRARFTLVASR